MTSACKPVTVAAVEAAQPLDPRLVAGGDPVEVVLHAGREVVVDEHPKWPSSSCVTAKATKLSLAIPFLKT